jgi:beta-N-acetylhexosaminidase
LRAKVRLGLMKKKLVELNEIANVMQSSEAAEHVQRIADQSVTLLRNENNVLPLAVNGQPCLALINSLRISQQGQRLVRDFRRKAPKGQVFTVDTGMPYDALDAVVQQGKTCTTIIVASFAAITANTSDVNRMIQKLIDGQVPVVIATFNDPYMGAAFPKAAAYLTPFSSAPSAEVAAAKALFGEIDIKGHTPVTIPEVAPMGAGIELARKAR